VTTVREATYALLRSWGVTTVFGNPGSNELPFLAGFPGDLTYVLGLHEGAVLAMADGYAQATGRPAFVNLHSAAGLGNAVGNLANAAAAHTPLVVTAGQQARAMIGLGSVLAEPRMTRVPEPQVKWSAEPARAQDVPGTLAQAFGLAALPPRGPVFVSLPLDDWAAEVVPSEVEHLAGRRVAAVGGAPAPLLARLATRLAAAADPVLVVGPEVDEPGVFEDVVTLSERCGLPVWIAPTPPRCPFPTDHPHFRGVLPASIAGVSGALAGHDLVLVLGAPVFRYHAYRPGPYLPPGASLVAVTSDPDEAARAPMGDAVVGDVAQIARQLLGAFTAGPRAIAPRQSVSRVDAGEAPFPVAAVFDAMARVLPSRTVYVSESTSNTPVFWDRVPMNRPGSYYFPAAGGLGFGLPAAIGIQLAVPDRPVVAVLGDGAVQYAVSALWTAVRYGLPVTFVVLRNDSYGALKWFASHLGAGDLPGLDLPGIDAVTIARGYGMAAERAVTVDRLAALLEKAPARGGPLLVEVPIVPETYLAG
jgi:benzoylformate decarboxylase